MNALLALDIADTIIAVCLFFAYGLNFITPAIGPLRIFIFLNHLYPLWVEYAAHTFLHTLVLLGVLRV